MKNPNLIPEELIQKYWDAETSTHEESELRDSLASNYLGGSDLEVYFKMQHLYRQAKCSDQLSAKLEAIARENKPKLIKISFLTLRNIAASLVLVMGSIALFQYLSSSKANSNLYADTYENPEQAWQAIKSALSVVSENMDMSTDILTEEIIKLDVNPTIEQ